VELYASGQALLRRQRFLFPSDWLEYDMVEGEWLAFNEILKRKTEAINAEVSLFLMLLLLYAFFLPLLFKISDSLLANEDFSGGQISR